MAKAQDLVFAGEAEPSSIEKYNPLMWAQGEICDTNLTLRQMVILADIHNTNPYFKKDVIDQFHALTKNQYWAESASYWDYTLIGLEWYRKRHGLPEDAVTTMNAITASYEAVKPCPLPECRDGGEPTEGPDYVSTPNYFCKRWKNLDGTIRAYLLIALNIDPEPRANLHHHLEAGYFAFGNIKTRIVGRGSDPLMGPETYEAVKSFEWKHRCKPYQGFDFKESFTSSALADCLPKGAMPPTWRAKPPKVTATQKVEDYRTYDTTFDSFTRYIDGATVFRFSWNNGLLSKQSRTIEVLPDKVVVTDGGLFRKEKVTVYEV